MFDEITQECQGLSEPQFAAKQPEVYRNAVVHTDLEGLRQKLQRLGQAVSRSKLSQVKEEAWAVADELAPFLGESLVGLVYARQKLKSSGVSERKHINYAHLFPMFVLGFLAMALLNTGGLLPHLTLHMDKSWFFAPGDRNVNLAGLLEQISRFCIVISMAGVGLETKFASMRQTGLKPFVASLVAVLVVALLILALIKSFGM